MIKCEKCDNLHYGTYGSGRFCSRACANSRIWTEEKKARHSIIAKNSEKVRLANENRRGVKIIKTCPICENTFEHHPSETRTYCSRKCHINDRDHKFSKAAPGGYRKGAGRTKGSYYKNQYFDSPFEIEVAKFLEEHDIKWKRNTKRFYFEWDGKQTYYIPDFLIGDDLYLETKGYWWPGRKERTKKAVNINNLNWVVLMQKEEWNIDRNILLEKLSGGGRIG